MTGSADVQRLVADRATVEGLLLQAQRLVGTHGAQQVRVEAIRREVVDLDVEATTLVSVAAALETLLTLVSRESLETLERLVTYGLKTVFEDLTLQFRIEIETKRGLQWMEPILLDGKVSAPILDAFGGGPASIVAFLLRLIACRRLGLAPVLLIDESFSFVSDQYVEPLAKLLRQLAEMMGVTLIVVTHHPGYLRAATRAYMAEERGGATVFVPA